MTQEQIEQAKDRIVQAAREWRKAFAADEEAATHITFNALYRQEELLAAAIDSYEAALIGAEMEEENV